ncbi:MAG: ATP-dependent DNA helicase RecG [Alphaproteobacteria bacterium]
MKKNDTANMVELSYRGMEPVTSLSGVGPHLAAQLEKLNIKTLLDLSLHVPSRREAIELWPGRIPLPEKTVAMQLFILQHRPGKRGYPYKIQARIGTQNIDLIFYHAYPQTLARQFPLDQCVMAWGKPDLKRGQLQVVHPEPIPADQHSLVRLIYPTTEGLRVPRLQRLIKSALAQLPDIEEWLPPQMLMNEGWQDVRTSLNHLHATDEVSENLLEQARRRLAFDEMLAHQRRLLRFRSLDVSASVQAPVCPKDFLPEILKVLPFTLTDDQFSAVEKCLEKAKTGKPLSCLLQGDVGSGKTLVAFCVMAYMVMHGWQSCLMAPTDILAKQHEATIAPLANALGLPLMYLSGRLGSKQRRDALNAISEQVGIVIGTHALFQDEVAFKALGCVVIDEQHRFGVAQRAALTQKGKCVHFMAMTATPIPRTLAMTLYGDLDVIKIREKPKGRLPIETIATSIRRLDDLCQGLKRILSRGEQAFWICPVIEEDSELGLMSAVARAKMLEQHYPGLVGLVHGQLSSDEKDQVMASFANGDCKVLVATTVVEVGVNIPQASVMVVEHAERFGLAQLHQLRGRVGRGHVKSRCVLLYYPPLGEVARERIAVLRDTEDGFLIAEEDLKLRGAGDLVGTRQSGVPFFRFANLVTDSDLLVDAQKFARMSWDDEKLRLLDLIFSERQDVDDHLLS